MFWLRRQSWQRRTRFQMPPLFCPAKDWAARFLLRRRIKRRADVYRAERWNRLVLHQLHYYRSWYYNGCGTILRAHHEQLDVPAYAEEGGEEGEIAGVYFIG